MMLLEKGMFYTEGEFPRMRASSSLDRRGEDELGKGSLLIKTMNLQQRRLKGCFIFLESSCT